MASSSRGPAAVQDGLHVLTRGRARKRMVVSAVLLFEGGLAVVACSSDAGPVAETRDGATVDSAPDTAADTAVALDAGREGGHCSSVTGACDVVLQDCPTGQECVTTSAGKAICQPAQASQSREKGAACCPGAANQCLPGLTCVGTACVDGGPESGRCTPACCRGDDRSCGASIPEGISGSCELGLVDSAGKDLYTVCTYRPRCTPFTIEPCLNGAQACNVDDKRGAATCIDSNGKLLGETCQFANDCVNGLYCLTLSGGDGGVCRRQCVTPGQTPPFDASADFPPGRGGCDTMQGCNLGPFSDLPAWLSFCRFSDGG